MALAAGTRLGPYEVNAQIGVGGMGEVYRATDPNLKRQIAIKVLPASVAGSTASSEPMERSPLRSSHEPDEAPPGAGNDAGTKGPNPFPLGETVMVEFGTSERSTWEGRDLSEIIAEAAAASGQPATADRRHRNRPISPRSRGVHALSAAVSCAVCAMKPSKAVASSSGRSNCTA
jgi:hypothetical protein